MVEGLDLPPGHILVHGLHQMEPFLQRNGNTRFAQGGEEGQEHGIRLSRDQPRRKMNSWSFQAPTG
ncbi:hypothetical protein D3C75_1267740 [compost metagenome]